MQIYYRPLSVANPKKLKKGTTIYQSVVRRFIPRYQTSFYSGEQLSAAKQQLLDDISEMNSSIKLPHMPRRRDGDKKAIKETDDIISLFIFIDENKLQDVSASRYVSDNPDAMPPIRLYEGDLHGIVKMLSALGNKVEEYGTMTAMLSRDMQEVQSGIALPWQPRPAQDTCRQHDQAGRPVPLPLVEFPTIEEANSVSQSADRAERQHQLDWATASTSTSTPSARSNRFAPLLITDDDEQDEHSANQPFIQQKRKGNKRARNHSSQQQQSSAPKNATSTPLGHYGSWQDDCSPRRYSGRCAHPPQESCLLVDNCSTSCTEQDIKDFVTRKLSIQVLSQNHDDDAMNWSPTTEKRSGSVSWRRIVVDCSTQSCGQTRSWSPTGSSRRRERKTNVGEWTRERMQHHQSTDRQQQLLPTTTLQHQPPPNSGKSSMMRQL